MKALIAFVYSAVGLAAPVEIFVYATKCKSVSDTGSVVMEWQVGAAKIVDHGDTSKRGAFSNSERGHQVSVEYVLWQHPDLGDRINVYATLKDDRGTTLLKGKVSAAQDEIVSVTSGSCRTKDDVGSRTMEFLLTPML